MLAVLARPPLSLSLCASEVSKEPFFQYIMGAGVFGFVCSVTNDKK